MGRKQYGGSKAESISSDYILWFHFATETDNNIRKHTHTQAKETKQHDSVSKCVGGRKDVKEGTALTAW